jgi:uncharacterized protein (TIGR03545 family)
MTDINTTPPPRTKKKKGLLRTEAIVPFLIVVVVAFLYFTFIFDHNLRMAFEWIGYEVVGAEVDIASLETSFIHATIRVQDIEITNPDKPELNMLKIGDVRFGLLWDALLRAKFVVNEMAVEKIEIAVPRSHRGKVKPPPPPPSVIGQPTALEKETGKVENAAVNTVETKYKGNVLGDIAAVLGGKAGGSDAQLKNLEESLPSKKRLDAFSKELSEKQKKWDAKLKTLPQNAEIQALGKRLSEVKTNNFKNPQEVIDSVQKIGAILQDADGKYKTVTSVAGELATDLNSTNQEFNEINALVNKDIQTLESHFHIPHLDAKSLGTSVLEQYLAPYLAKINHYRTLALKYVPPNVMKKASGGGSSGPSEPDISMQPRPRARGVSYEFGRPNSYPMVWVKRISISSQAGATHNSGNIHGLVTDLTTNQLLTGKPTAGEFDGNFPDMEVTGLQGKFSFDNRKESSVTDFDFSVAGYPIDGKELVSSPPDARVAFKKAYGALKSHGQLIALSNLDFNLDNQISKIDYDITAQNPVIDDVLKKVFAGLPVITIDAHGKGELPANIALDVNSNIGPELQKGFEKQLSAKVEEMKGKIQAAINQAIGGERSQIESQLKIANNDVNGQVKKVEDALNAQKAKGEKDMNQSKSGSQKQLENAAQKGLEDLKKQLGF